MKRIVILGSTGSIGHKTLDIVRAFPDQLVVVGLAAWNNQDLLLDQAKEFHPQFISSKNKPPEALIPPGTHFLSDLNEMVTNSDVDLVVQGMVGNAGLFPTLAAVRAGKQIALANKEPIIMAGELLTKEGHQIDAYHVVKDEPASVQKLVQNLSKEQALAAIIINGGTGISERDSTFEAIDGLLEKRLVGFGEIFRYLSYKDIGSSAILSRATAGLYQGKVIFSIPGSSGAVRLAMEALIIPELSHIVGEIQK